MLTAAGRRVAILCVVAALVEPSHGEEQPPGIVWETVIENPTPDFGGDLARAVIETRDGGFAAVGSVYLVPEGWRQSRADWFVLKTDGDGKPEWSLRRGEPVRWEHAGDVLEDEKGDLLVLGSVRPAERFRISLTKLRPDGEVLWSRAYHHCPTDPGESGAFDIRRRAKGGYYLFGHTYGECSTGPSLMYLLAVTEEGDVLWERTFGDRHVGTSMDVLEDGSLILGGFGDEASDAEDIVVVKTDPEGNQLWKQVFVRPGHERLTDIRATRDGGSILVAQAYDSSPQTPDPDIFELMLKLDGAGEIVWERKLGWWNDLDAFGVLPLPDGGYLVSGNKGVWDNESSDLWLAKFSGSGEFVWEKTWGSALSDVGYGLRLAADGGLLLAGRLAGDFYLAKLGRSFLRGDANADQRRNLSDAVHLLLHLFAGGAAPGCAEAADTDDSGAVDLADVVYGLNFLFLGGPPPPAPCPECGPDPTPDQLPCANPGC